MALLQISEPGQSKAPHQKKLAVGIDLGTTNSLVASVRSGTADTLPDAHGKALLPSVCYYGEDKVLVGHSALLQANDDPDNTIQSVKRLMGRGIDDVTSLNDTLPYRFEPSEGMPNILTRQGPVSPVQVSANILSTLKQRAVAALGGELEGAVITVPAYFDDAQRQATKDAARIAGLDVLRLINEPTAAAIAYGLDQAAEGTHVVFDLGGGTFDVSVLKLEKGVIEVLATGGDTALGGDDFDQRIAQWILEQCPVDGAPDRQLNRYLLNESQRFKEALTDADAVAVNVHHQDFHFEGQLTRDQFRELASPLLERANKVCRRALRDAKVDIASVKDIVLVGGSTRMPILKQSIKAFFDRDPLDSLDPDKVVALGAAMQADRLVGNQQDDELVLLDVVPLSLCVETMGGLSEKIIRRNTAIPITRAQEFTTYKDGQSAMSIHVLQGEREKAEANRSLGKFTLSGIPPMAAGTARILVTYRVDADGLLTVSAKESMTEVESTITVKPSYGLEEAEITRMLHEAVDCAHADMTERNLSEQRIEAEQIVSMLETALANDSELLEAEEAHVLQTEIAKLKLLCKTDHLDNLKAQIKRLNQLSEPFAERRMTKSMKQALVGKHIPDMDG